MADCASDGRLLRARSGHCLTRRQHAGKRFTYGVKCLNAYLFTTLIVRISKKALWIRSS